MPEKMEKKIDLNSPITALSGIGPKRADLFAALGVFTVGDLLRLFPRGYQNRGDVKTLCEAAMSGETSSMILTVGSEPKSVTVKNRMTLTKFTAFDESGKCQIVFFNQGYIRQLFHIGETYRFYGKVTRTKSSWNLSSPDFEPTSLSRALPDFYAVYPLTAGLSQKIVRGAIALALDGAELNCERVPEKIRKENSLIDFAEATRIIHRPQNLEQLERARKYFVFEELFEFALSVMHSKREKENVPGAKLSLSDEDKRAFVNALSFALTDAQARVIREIYADMGSGRAMHRLVSGDVGSGKTVCAAAALYLAAKNSRQAAFMAPTEILATQHYRDLSVLFEGLGIKCTLLVGSMTKAQKNAAYAEIASGEAKVIIGTHALISQGVEFCDLALAVTDEQHRFGVNQREMLSAKGKNLHVLVMSATPIPRTLAMSIYGDLDHSAVDSLPPGRQKVSTFLVDETYRERLTGFIRTQASEGRQIYVVCPAIESGDTTDGETDTSALVDFYGKPMDFSSSKLKSATEHAQNLAKALDGVSVACLHGKMHSAEKDTVMRDFVDGKVSVLVSTTVIEVGVNVPNATLMIIENAERFGLSQLHQLRGRVGRGKYKSWCILVGENLAEQSKKRLEALCETSDGYRIAEADLALRGPGDFFFERGKELRQHGALSFRMADLYSDMDVLHSAFEAAKSFCDKEI
ncbi:MAG: ATP-dependent DNA helicase RecG [Ruminococcaceae bacterium]|nr:ATP-dependent DNA helicase RecG [Oscillospiraceae bacterium]